MNTLAEMNENTIASKLIAFGISRRLVDSAVARYASHHQLSREFSPDQIESELNYVAFRLARNCANYHEKRKLDPNLPKDDRYEDEAILRNVLIASFHNAMTDIYLAANAQKRGIHNEFQIDTADASVALENSASYDMRDKLNEAGAKGHIISVLRRHDMDAKANNEKVCQLARVFVALINPRHKHQSERVRQHLGMSHPLFVEHREALFEILRTELKEEALEIMSAVNNNYTALDKCAAEADAFRKLRYNSTKLDVHEDDYSCTQNVVYRQKILKNGKVKFSARVTVDRQSGAKWTTIKEWTQTIDGTGLTFTEAKKQLAQLISKDVEKAKKLVRERHAAFEKYRHHLVRNRGPSKRADLTSYKRGA